MNEDFALEFLVTVLAIYVGLIIGKKASVFIQNTGRVQIAAGDPQRM